MNATVFDWLELVTDRRMGKINRPREGKEGQAAPAAWQGPQGRAGEAAGRARAATSVQLVHNFSDVFIYSRLETHIHRRQW